MAVAADPRESIIVWTEEERRYLRRLLSHDFLSSTEEIRRALTVRRMNGAGAGAARKPAGEFRILVLGAKGTGKTSLLTRVSAGIPIFLIYLLQVPLRYHQWGILRLVLPKSSAGRTTSYQADRPLPPPQICHNRLPTADSTSPDTETPRNYRTTVDIDSQPYTFDALELPSQNLWRDDLIQQAIGITDAALLLYSTSDPPSLGLARGLAELISDTVISANREYSILLAGNKSDAGETERVVAYSEGSRVAGGFGIKTSFMEVSAVSGDQAGLVLPRLGRDVLLLRGIREQRREYAEKVRREAGEGGLGGGTGQGRVGSVRKKEKAGLWKRISRPFFTRREVVQN